MNLIIDDINITLLSTLLSINFIFFLIFNASAKFVGVNLRVIKKRKFLSNENVYLLGGYFIFIPIFTLIIYTLIFSIENFVQNFIINISMFAILIFGIIDDNIDLKPMFKTFISLTIFFFLIYSVENLRIDLINIYFIEYNLSLFESLIFTVLCLFILQNTINFSDGINGIALIIVICLHLILLFYNQDKNLFYLIIFILNALILTLILNLNNKLFLGDAGVNLISFLTAINIISVYSQNNSLLTQEKIFLYLLFPGLDLSRLVFERIYKRINPTKKDVNHLHHLLYKKIGQLRTLLIYAAIILSIFILTEIFKVKVFLTIGLLILAYLFIFKKLKK